MYMEESKCMSRSTLNPIYNDYKCPFCVSLFIFYSNSMNYLPTKSCMMCSPHTQRHNKKKNMSNNMAFYYTMLVLHQMT